MALRNVVVGVVVSTVLLGLPWELQAQARHVVRIEDASDEDESGYSPATITARRGDVVVFRAGGKKRHSISFERSIPDGARAALNAAMPDRVGDLAGPMLAPGTEYRIVVPASLPAGRYRFFCLPHRAYDEVGWLIVE